MVAQVPLTQFQVLQGMFTPSISEWEQALISRRLDLDPATPTKFLNMILSLPKYLAQWKDKTTANLVSAGIAELTPELKMFFDVMTHFCNQRITKVTLRKKEEFRHYPHVRMNNILYNPVNTRVSFFLLVVIQWETQRSRKTAYSTLVRLHSI